MTITIAVAATFLVTLLLLNLSSGEKKIATIERLYGISDDNFRLTIGSLMGVGLIQGNRVTPLINGDQIFPSMLEAIGAAKSSICLETYIYWSGVIGRKFSEALAAKAQQGVVVHVILDWVGCGRMDQESLELMTSAGVQIEKYHPLRWYSLARLNNRTHRKLLIVDGRVGFTGGVGIADQWLGNADSPDHWRDSHFKLEGPAVAQMQSIFIDNWATTKGTVLHGPKYFPKLESVAGSLTQVVKSSMRDGTESIRLLYLLSIISAERSIRIASAYFVPDDLTVESLIKAKKRGVEVEILIPGKRSDIPIVRRASRARYGALLKAGIAIFEYQPTMFHCKIFIVDSLWVSVGSTNFDSRSFRLNDEANLNVYDPELAASQELLFQEDKARSRAVTYRQWKKRPLGERLVDGVCALARSQI